MTEILIGLLPIIVMGIVYLTLSVIGVVSEQRHEKDLDRREAAIGNFPLFDTKTLPPGVSGTAGQLISGNVVMGTGYLKQFLAGFRQLVGGEVRGYQRVLSRARREAQLRMIEAAQQQGATAIINVRFETSDVGGMKPFAEVMCYGTMVR